MDEKTFLQDVAKHQMTIIRNDGVNRHIRFSKPDTTCMHFDLITWPGHLCYTGDMGTYVFTRLTDMFEFFRNDREYNKKQGRQLSINRGYWSEKCIAADRDGIEKYSPEKFKQRINERLNDMEASAELRASVNEDVMSYADDGEVRAYDAATNFTDDNGNEVFPDFWEVDLKDYTHRFTWCCYALAWGIEQYDNTQQGETK